MASAENDDQHHYNSRVADSNRWNSDPDSRTVLALHPNGAVSVMNQQAFNNASAKMDPFKKEAMALHSTTMFGYTTTCVCSDAADEPLNLFATQCLSACKSEISFMDKTRNTTICGPAYILDDFRSISLNDWPVLKHCWQAQTTRHKAIWKDQLLVKHERQRDILWERNPSARVEKEWLAVFDAMESHLVQYLASSSEQVFELLLSQKQLRLIAVPEKNSMEWTGKMDCMDSCDENPSLKNTKIALELEACAYLQGFQTKNGLGNFRPNTSIPILAADLTWFLWVQVKDATEEQGHKNEKASRLAGMDIFGDALLSRSSVIGPADATATHLESLTDLVESKMRICSHCEKQSREGCKFSVCSRCKVARFCSRDCQRKAWKTHKRECVPFSNVAEPTTRSPTASSALPLPREDNRVENPSLNPQFMVWVGLPKIVLLVHSPVRDNVLAQLSRNGVSARPSCRSGIMMPCIYRSDGFVFFPGRGYVTETVAALLGMTVDQFRSRIGGNASMLTVPYDMNAEGTSFNFDCVFRVNYGQESQGLYQRVPGPECKQCKMGPSYGGPVVLFRAALKSDGLQDYYEMTDISDVSEDEYPRIAGRLLEQEQYPY